MGFERRGEHADGRQQPARPGGRVAVRVGGQGGWPLFPGRMATLALAVAACAALPARAENWTIRPTIGVTETLTDNVFLSATDPTGDLVTAISPGISIDGKGARGSLTLGYVLTEQFYLRESSQRNRQNALNAVGTLEAIEDFLFIDASGNISQQYLSALGTVSPSIANIDRNRTETSSYTLSPYIRGTLHNWVDYQLRYRAMTTSSKSDLVPGLNSQEWTGGLDGSTRWSHITWALDASRVDTDYEFGRDYEATRYNVTLAYRFSPQFQASLLGGRESNNYVSLDQQTNFTRGVGFDWTPSARTRLNATVRNRFFGTGYDLSFKHRRPRSLVTFVASKDVSLQPQGAGSTGRGGNYDAFYAIIAAANPDLAPSAVAAQTAQLLVDRGIPADGTVVNGHLSDRPNVQELQQLTAALLGVRNTVTLTATRNVQQGLSLINGLTNDFSTSGRTLQRGYGIIWSHQLTGFSSLSLSLNQQRSSTFVSNSPETTTSGGYLLFSTRFSPRTTANVGARRVISSGVSSYTENALTGAISHSF